MDFDPIVFNFLNPTTDSISSIKVLYINDRAINLCYMYGGKICDDTILWHDNTPTLINNFDDTEKGFDYSYIRHLKRVYIPQKGYAISYLIRNYDDGRCGLYSIDTVKKNRISRTYIKANYAPNKFVTIYKLLNNLADVNTNWFDAKLNYDYKILKDSVMCCEYLPLAGSNQLAVWCDTKLTPLPHGIFFSMKILRIYFPPFLEQGWIDAQRERVSPLQEIQQPMII